MIFLNWITSLYFRCASPEEECKHHLVVQPYVCVWFADKNSVFQKKINIISQKNTIRLDVIPDKKLNMFVYISQMISAKCVLHVFLHSLIFWPHYIDSDSLSEFSYLLITRDPQATWVTLQTSPLCVTHTTHTHTPGHKVLLLPRLGPRDGHGYLN